MPALLGPLLALSGALAAELTIPVPPGVRAHPGNLPYAITDARIAFAAQRCDPVCGPSTLIQYADGAATYSDFTSPIGGLEYSPDGSLLLVHSFEDPSEHEGTSRVGLVDTRGRLIWSRSERRVFHFSTSGDVIYAWSAAWPNEGGNTVEILDLRGGVVGRATLGESLRSAIVLGSGEQAVLVTRRSIVWIDVARGTVVRRLSLGIHPDALGAYALDAERFVVALQRSTALVVNVRGDVDCVYAPPAAGSDPPIRAYRLHAEGAAALTVFDGTAEASTVDIGTGRSNPQALDTSAPPGFALVDLTRQGLLFASPSAVLVRPTR
ncbi:MAG TPA: hypothetical protein VJS92_16795 [Candidatus Polarisedimenticolaceae bacterium]|nr:hypothetical protein [Candidatus Polarisedimenticolaceae bacterium]